MQWEETLDSQLDTFQPFADCDGYAARNDKIDEYHRFSDRFDLIADALIEDNPADAAGRLLDLADRVARAAARASRSQ